jgi:anti-sigma factor RsiW
MERPRCLDPGEVQDWELEAYADGEVYPHVERHLRECSACRIWLAERMLLDCHLHRALYRFDCPSPDLLRDYHWGHLAGDERRQVEDHLDACPHCTAELAELAEFVASEGAQPSSTLLARARQAAAELRLVVAQLVAPGLSPVPALRGRTREVLLFDAEGTALSVNLEQEDSGAYNLLGQILSPEPAAPLTGYARLTAREEGVVPVEVPLGANGVFTLPNVRPGVYQLVVRLPEQRIVVPILALRSES